MAYILCIYVTRIDAVGLLARVRRENFFPKEFDHQPVAPYMRNVCQTGCFFLRQQNSEKGHTTGTVIAHYYKNRGATSV